MKLKLPLPPLLLQTHSLTLRERIASEIAAHGPIKFSRFMQRCLYEPGLGYYSAGLSKLGSSGDFTTAPELGRQFAQRLVRYLAAPLRALGEHAELLELGPGSGALAEVLLEGLLESGVTLKRYRLLEVSADLADRQRARLQRFGALLEWIDAPPAEPWSGIVIGNEVVDALPVDLFKRSADQAVELRVGLNAAQLTWTEALPDASTMATIEARLSENPSAELPEQRGEVMPSLSAWLQAVTEKMTRGACVLIDYGASRAELNHPSRSAGTLQCHYRHRAHFDPLVLLGLQDLTALVDFTELTHAAHAIGFQIDLYTTQAHFLIALGIAEAQGHLDPREQLNLAQEIRRLTHPLEMGERFKVLAFSRDLELLDLTHIDRSSRL